MSFFFQTTGGWGKGQQFRYLLVSLCLFAGLVLPATNAFSQETFDAGTPADRAALMEKMVALPCGILPTDGKPTILQKMRVYLENFEPSPNHPDDPLALQSVIWALKGVESGGYGIGAVIAHQDDGLLLGAHNAQIQQNRSDLHGEMNLLNGFESKKKFRKYLKSWGFTGGNTIYDEKLTVYSSAEPCPMCFVRLSIAGVKTKYVTKGPDDGMTAHVDCLPKFWSDLAKQNPIEKADASPVLAQMAHVLFFSFML